MAAPLGTRRGFRKTATDNVTFFCLPIMFCFAQGCVFKSATDTQPLYMSHFSLLCDASLSTQVWFKKKGVYSETKFVSQHFT